MNRKLILGFLAGVVAASGVSYLITHRKPAAAPLSALVQEVAPPPSLPAPAPQAVALPQPAPASEARKIAPARTAKPRIAVAPLTSVAPPSAPPAVPESVAILSPPSTVPTPVPQPEPLSRPEPLNPPAPWAPTPNTAPAASTVMIPPGTSLSVRLSEGLSSDHNRAGDEFAGTLDQPLVIDGLVIAERGARVEGRVAEAVEAGRVRGLARLSLELTRLHTSDGQRVAIHTASFVKQGPESKQEDVAKVGIGAAVGAIIGAAAGGGKGAAIGAATGGAVGGGVVAATRGKPAVLPVETVVSFRTAEPITLTERLN
jgi:hypothetical protein